ncbi:RNA-directed DNA polymerase from mobile element jockey [Trichonephila clavipes]|nr:RNA-directed DNA polymerase from mobile element jockey [Trichonephila clavipes]
MDGFQGLVYGTREKADLFVDTLEDSFQENITPYDDDHIDKVDRTTSNTDSEKETSTCHQLLRATNKIISGFNNHATTGGIFLDVEKAFDRLWHNGLIFKMINLNYPPYLIHTISVYLLNRTFQVKIQATISKIGHIQAGSPQGSLLSPILYNIYTYDFPTSPLVDICLFADDAAILSQQDTPQKNRALRLILNAPTYIKRIHIHKDLKIPALTSRIKKLATAFYEQVNAHSNSLINIQAAMDAQRTHNMPIQTTHLRRRF